MPAMNGLPPSLTNDYDSLVHRSNWDGVRALLAPLVHLGIAEALYLWSLSSQPSEAEEAFSACPTSPIVTRAN